MKKNISINISGIIFHIEEDGYEILRKYLDSINRYFSSFEDNSEILADIESRIAEILLSKLSEGKQIVTAEDVNTLMATMGSVNDFKAAEEQEMGGAAAGTEQKQYRQQSSAASEEPIASKKLFRDERRKMLGGVCAGLAHYFSIDPLWPRLIFALLAVASYGGIFVVYILLWIFIPATNTLEEPVAAKKMYRDKDNRVIGGVAGGLAAYWNIDVTVARVLFICFMFLGGVGFIVYIIMWIALPEAKTITEKMQMQGEPVTLSNIESSVKKGLNEKDGTEESVLAKIILFPFRLIAAVIDGLAKVLGPVFILIVDIFRIGIGLCITLTGAFTIFALVLAFGIILGFFHVPVESAWNDWYWTQPDFPIETFSQTFPVWMGALAFIVAFVPALMIALLGASIIAKKIVFNSYVGWTLFVLFFVSAGVLSFSVPKVVLAFKEEGEYKVEKTFSMTGTPVLRLNEAGLEDYHVTELNIRGYDGKEIKLIQRFEAQGNTRRDATENAQMIDYNVIQSDSVLIFDSNIAFKPNAKFRAQRLEMELYVPINAPFIIEGDLWRLIDYYRGDYYHDRYENQTWKVNESGALECMTCYKTSDEEPRRQTYDDEFGLQDFNSIDLEGVFDVTIEQGHEFVVNLEGSRQDKDLYRIYVSGETLVIDHDQDVDKFWRRKEDLEDHQVKLFVTMPALNDIDARGVGKLRFRGFDEPDVDVSLTGAILANAGIDAGNLNIKIKGMSSLELAGTGNYLEADITGAGSLSAYGFETREAIIEAHGASVVKVYVTEKLEISKGITSSVHHRGSPRVIREN